MVDLRRFPTAIASSRHRTLQGLANQFRYWLDGLGTFREHEKPLVMVVDSRGVPLKHMMVKRGSGPDGVPLSVLVMTFGEPSPDEED